MSDNKDKSGGGAPTVSETAWQPFTPRGVASATHASLSRIFSLQLIVAALAAAVVVWFLQTNYAPSITEAIANLPDGAALQSGALTNVQSGILTEKNFLSVIVDAEEQGQIGRTSDVQVELRRTYFQLCSLLGCGGFEYPSSRTIPLGRSTAEPWWGARQPIILGICGALAFVQVWLSWILFAVVYAPILKLITFCSARRLSWVGSWRIASVAQVPGALLMSLAIFLYGVQAFDLIRFLFFFAAHFLISWVYIGFAPLFLPRVAENAPDTTNPFGKA